MIRFIDSGIFDFCMYLPFTKAYRSLTRPSSSLSA